MMKKPDWSISKSSTKRMLVQAPEEVWKYIDHLLSQIEEKDKRLKEIGGIINNNREYMFLKNSKIYTLAKVE